MRTRIPKPKPHQYVPNPQWVEAFHGITSIRFITANDVERVYGDGPGQLTIRLRSADDVLDLILAVAGSALDTAAKADLIHVITHSAHNQRLVASMRTV